MSFASNHTLFEKEGPRPGQWLIAVA